MTENKLENLSEIKPVINEKLDYFHAILKVKKMNGKNRKEFRNVLFTTQFEIQN